MRNMSMKGKLQTVHKSAPIRFGASPCMLLPRFIDAKINNGSWVANGTPWRPKGLKVKWKMLRMETLQISERTKEEATKLPDYSKIT